MFADHKADYEGSSRGAITGYFNQSALGTRRFVEPKALILCDFVMERADGGLQEFIPGDPTLNSETQVPENLQKLFKQFWTEEKEGNKIIQVVLGQLFRRIHGNSLGEDIEDKSVDYRAMLGNVIPEQEALGYVVNVQIEIEREAFKLLQIERGAQIDDDTRRLRDALGKGPRTGGILAFEERVLKEVLQEQQPVKKVIARFLDLRSEAEEVFSDSPSFARLAKTSALRVLSGDYKTIDEAEEDWQSLKRQATELAETIRMPQILPEEVAYLVFEGRYSSVQSAGKVYEELVRESSGKFSTDIVGKRLSKTAINHVFKGRFESLEHAKSESKQIDAQFIETFRDSPDLMQYRKEIVLGVFQGKHNSIPKLANEYKKCLPKVEQLFGEDARICDYARYASALVIRGVYSDPAAASSACVDAVNQSKEYFAHEDESFQEIAARTIFEAKYMGGKQALEGWKVSLRKARRCLGKEANQEEAVYKVALSLFVKRFRRAEDALAVYHERPYTF